jgi:hypothetical protein
VGAGRREKVGGEERRSPFVVGISLLASTNSTARLAAPRKIECEASAAKRKGVSAESSKAHSLRTLAGASPAVCQRIKSFSN